MRSHLSARCMISGSCCCIHRIRSALLIGHSGLPPIEKTFSAVIFSRHQRCCSAVRGSCQEIIG